VAQKYAWSIMDDFGRKNQMLPMYGVVGQQKITKWSDIGVLGNV